jgi:hypothetical protein
MKPTGSRPTPLLRGAWQQSKIRCLRVTSFPRRRVGELRLHDELNPWHLPATGWAFLDIIPPIGSKFTLAGVMGPESPSRQVNGVHRGTVLFRFGIPQTGNL